MFFSKDMFVEIYASEEVYPAADHHAHNDG